MNITRAMIANGTDASASEVYDITWEWEKLTTPVIWMTTNGLTAFQHPTSSMFALTPWHTPYVSTIMKQRPSPQSTAYHVRRKMSGRIVHHDTFTNVATGTGSFDSSDKHLKLMIVQQFHDRINICIAVNAVQTRIQPTSGETPCQHHMPPGSQHKASVTYSLSTKYTMCGLIISMDVLRSSQQDAHVAPN